MQCDDGMDGLCSRRISVVKCLFEEPQEYKTYHYAGVRLIVMNDDLLQDLHSLGEN